MAAETTLETMTWSSGAISGGNWYSGVIRIGMGAEDARRRGSSTEGSSPPPPAWACMGGRAYFTYLQVGGCGGRQEHCFNDNMERDISPGLQFSPKIPTSGLH